MKMLFILLFLNVFNLSTNGIETPNCTKSTNEARADLKKGRINFMVHEGIVKVYEKSQVAFEKKYNVKYFNLGCMAPMNLCIEHYNAEVATYLDKKYGKSWRKEVKTGVLQPTS